MNYWASSATGAVGHGMKACSCFFAPESTKPCQMAPGVLYNVLSSTRRTQAQASTHTNISGCHLCCLAQLPHFGHWQKAYKRTAIPEREHAKTQAPVFIDCGSLGVATGLSGLRSNYDECPRLVRRAQYHTQPCIRHPPISTE